MSDRDDLERLIDGALASYADPGPSSGLERRILARISTTHASTRRRRLLIWATGLPAAAVACTMLLFVSSSFRHAQPHPHKESGSPVAKVPFSAAGAAPRMPVRSVIHERKASRHAIRQVSAMPKLDIFPTPAPLSSEEKALIGLVAETPVAKRQDLTTKWLQADEPIHIADLSIPSINPPAEGKE